MYRSLVIVEKTYGNYSAYSPDLLGCVATGATREETEERMHEATLLHIEGRPERGGCPGPCLQVFGHICGSLAGGNSPSTGTLIISDVACGNFDLNRVSSIPSERQGAGIVGVSRSIRSYTSLKCRN